MRIRKFIELKCNYCTKPLLKELKEYNRQLKKGRSEFYCNLSCAAKSNECLTKYAKFNIDNPNEIKRKGIKFRKENPLFKSNEADDLSPFRRYLRKIKQRLKYDLLKGKDLGFNLTLESIKSQWDKQGGVCPYTKKKMDLVMPESDTVPIQASLDRIDSSRGYLNDNIEFVCLSANYAKNTFSREQMIEFFKL